MFFFSKCSKFLVDLRNAIKFLQKVFAFWDNCIWIGCGKFSLLWREFFSSAVNVLRNSSEILDLIKREVFQLNFFLECDSCDLDWSDVFWYEEDLEIDFIS